MNAHRLAVLGCMLVPGLLFAQQREDILSFQRDVAQLQHQVKQLQDSQDKKMAALQMLVQQAADQSAQVSAALNTLQKTMTDRLNDQQQRGHRCREARQRGRDQQPPEHLRGERERDQPARPGPRRNEPSVADDRARDHAQHGGRRGGVEQRSSGRMTRTPRVTRGRMPSVRPAVLEPRQQPQDRHRVDAAEDRRRRRRRVAQPHEDARERDRDSAQHRAHADVPLGGQPAFHTLSLRTRRSWSRKRRYASLSRPAPEHRSVSRPESTGLRSRGTHRRRAGSRR